MDFDWRSSWEVYRWIVSGFSSARARAQTWGQLRRECRRTAAFADGPVAFVFRYLCCFCNSTSKLSPENIGNSQSHCNQALLISTSFNVSRGQTTLETLGVRGDRRPERYICIPSDRSDGSEPALGEVFTVGWDERIYDLGFKENWRAISAKDRNG